jgi:uncharacterized protein YaaN involved in tellurite resistance
MTDSTITAAPTTGLGIDFSAIAGTDEANPQGVADQTLSRVDPSKPLETFSCRAGLTDKEMDQVHKIAKIKLAEFKQSPSVVGQFGDNAMDGLNATVTSILEQQGNLRIPDIERITKEMAKSVADFRRKYKDADPKLLEAMEKFVDSILGIFKAGNQFFKELQIDSQTAVKRLDSVAAKLVENKQILDRNVLLCDELYKQNEVGLSNLIGIIAIKEQIIEDLSAETVALRKELDDMPKDNSVDRRQKEEVLNNLLSMLEELDTRRTEFVSRLFVAWATAPQIRNLRKVSNSLSQRLHLLVVLTIPTMKLTIAQWGMQLQAQEGARVGGAVAQANEDALREYAASSSEVIPELALAAQTPSITPATIFALADSVVAQNEGLVNAIKQGQRMRAELDDTVAKQIRVINESNTKTQGEIIDLITRAKKPLVLEVAPTVPEEVLVYASEQSAA